MTLPHPDDPPSAARPRSELAAATYQVAAAFLLAVVPVWYLLPGDLNPYVKSTIVLYLLVSAAGFSALAHNFRREKFWVAITAAVLASVSYLITVLTLLALLLEAMSDDDVPYLAIYFVIVGVFLLMQAHLILCLARVIQARWQGRSLPRGFELLPLALKPMPVQADVDSTSPSI